MKAELLNKIFKCNWNVSSGKTEHIIGLYYSKGGFDKIVDYLEKKKESMPNFEAYYSKELIDLLKEAWKQYTHENFRGYAISKLHKEESKVALSNFRELDEANLLQDFTDFSTSFRGTILEVIKVNDFKVIRTICKSEIKFYLSGQASLCFNSIEEAIVFKLFNGKYFDTLTTLLKASK